MTPTAILIIVGIFALLAAVFARFDGLAWFAPKRTARVSPSASYFCENECKRPDGTCPLVEVHLKREDCPLWRFIHADLPTVQHGSPFAHLKGTKTAM